MIDTHSHLLPGIDDGAQTFEESLKILKGLSEQGFTDVILTPHYINSTSQVSPTFKNKQLYDLLRAKVIRAKIPVNLHLGNEIYIDRDLLKLIRFGQIKPAGKGNYLLVELPMSGEYGDYESIFISLMQAGYHVVLAHPERYHATQENYALLENLHEIGVLFQCNLGSFNGQYGKSAQKTAKKLAKDRLIFAIGTDIHHERDYAEIAEAVQKLEKYYNDLELEMIFDQNPQKMLTRAE